MYLTLLKHQGHQTLALDKEMGEERAVELAGEFEMTVMHSGAVDIDKRLVGIALEIELAAVQIVDTALADNLILGTGAATAQQK